MSPEFLYKVPITLFCIGDVCGYAFRSYAKIQIVLTPFNVKYHHKNGKYIFHIYKIIFRNLMHTKLMSARTQGQQMHTYLTIYTPKMSLVDTQ